MPSAAPASGAHALHGWARIVHGTGRFLAWSITLIVALTLAVGAYLYFFGFRNNQLSVLVRDAVQSIAGNQLISDLKDSRLSIDSHGNLALEATEISLRRPDGTQIASVDKTSLGLDLVSLVGGAVKIEDIDVTGVKLSGGVGGISVPSQFLNPSGKADPGTIAKSINDAAAALFLNLRNRGLENIRINELKLSATSKNGLSEVRDISFQYEHESGYALSAILLLGERELPIEGKLEEDSFLANVDGIQFGEQVDFDPALNVGQEIQLVPFHGNANLSLSGRRAQGLPGNVEVRVDVPEYDFQNFRRVRINGDAKFAVELREGRDTAEISVSHLNSGANQIRFTGAFGPVPADEIRTIDDYRFELISNEAVLMPSESAEAPVKAAGRISGTFNVAARQFNFTNINIRTASGDVIGKGEVTLGDKSPELAFAISIPKLNVADAKHIWPAIFASGARRWMMAHVFGGRLADSRIDISFGHGALWPKMDPSKSILPTPEQIRAQFKIEGARFDTVGDLPPVRDTVATIDVAGADTVISLSSGTAFLEDGSTVAVKDGTMAIPVQADQPVIASLDVTVEGEAASIADIANREPLNALEKAPVKPADISGTAVAAINASFPLRASDKSIKREWTAKVDFSGLTIKKDFNGQTLSEATGTLDANASEAVFAAKGKLNGVPASIELREPLGSKNGQRQISAKLQLDDAARAKLAPGLSDILKGPVDLMLIKGNGERQEFEARLDRATLSLPWAGWSKGQGVPASAKFELVTSDKATRIENLSVKGGSFVIEGSATLNNKSFSSADFTRVTLNKGDNFRVKIARAKAGYNVEVSGKSIDLRALLKRVTGSFEKAAEATGGAPISLSADLASATGFNGEQLSGVIARYNGVGSDIRSFAASAKSASGGSVAIENSVKDGGRRVTIQTSDGGAVLRFMDIYDKMQGGNVSIELRQADNGVLSGTADARNFTVRGEQRLKALIGAPVGPDGQPVEGAREKLDVSTVKFERGTTEIQKGKGFLKLKDGILRSSQFGLSYSGTLYDQKGRIDLSGTFLPIYGLNRIFGELPIFGEILGNGRDKALLGITFKLQGDAKSPDIAVNPISIIAPGIFRKMFEFQ